MTPSELDEIEKRANAATPGHWYSLGWLVMVDALFFAPKTVVQTFDANDADFVSHARTDVPALLAEVRRLQGIVAGKHPVAVCDYADKPYRYETMRSADDLWAILFDHFNSDAQIDLATVGQVKRKIAEWLEKR